MLPHHGGGHPENASAGVNAHSLFGISNVTLAKSTDIFMGGTGCLGPTRNNSVAYDPEQAIRGPLDKLGQGVWASDLGLAQIQDGILCSKPPKLFSDSQARPRSIALLMFLKLP